MEDILHEVVNQFLGVVLSALAALLGALVVQGIRFVQAKIEEAKPKLPDVLKEIIIDAISAAEQSKLAGKIENTADAALDFAIAYVQRELNERGFNYIDVDAIAEKIEAALWQEINQYRKNTAE